MQARYYDPVIGRFYSNDPVDSLGHMQRGNPIHGFGRYTYANNNPYKYVDPDGEFGILGAAIGFAIEGAVQIAQGELNVTKLVVSAVAGGAGVGLGQKAAQLGSLLANGSKLGSTAAQVTGAVTEAVATNVIETSANNAINSLTGANEMENINASGAATNAVANTPNGIHGFNRYAYGNNNPYRYKDPTGKSSEEANMWANMFGFSSAEQATTKINNSIENGRQAVVNSTSPENLSAVSDTLAGATVVALVAGQPEVAAVTGIGSFLAGVGAAVQSDDPVAGVVIETALQVTGTKSVGTAAKIVNGALDTTSAVKNGINAASDATQTVIKNEIKEEINNE